MGLNIHVSNGINVFICWIFLINLTCNALPKNVPPLYNLKAFSTYGIGYQVGLVGKERIQTWFKSCEMQNVFNFAFGSGSGNDAFQQIKQDSARLYPEYSEELEGIALGANVSSDMIWAMNMLSELENLPDFKNDLICRRENERANSSLPGHCTDVFVNSECHGHNEDWSIALKPFFYFVTLTSIPRESTVCEIDLKGNYTFSDCGGLLYPGAIVAWAPAWAKKSGLYSTQNSLFPKKSLRYGVLSGFPQKKAICESNNIDEALEILSKHKWAEGASVNLVDARGGGDNMVNVEVHESTFSIYNVSKNYTHENMYKHKDMLDGVGKFDASSFYRQEALNSFATPSNCKDIEMMLSDTSNTNYPVFRNITLTTMILNLKTLNLNVWCCGKNALQHDPVYQWDLSEWFK